MLENDSKSRILNSSTHNIYIKTTTAETIIVTTPGGEIDDVPSNGTNFDYEAPVFEDTETAENTTAIIFDGDDVDTTTIKTTTTTTSTTMTEKPVVSSKECLKFKFLGH